jgi:hypothetical protein
VGRRLRRPPSTPLRVDVGRVSVTNGVDFLNPGLPIFSRKLFDAFVSEGVDNLEAFPAILVEQSGGKQDGFLAINVVGVVAGADMEKSEFQDAQQRQRFTVSFEKLVLDPARTRDLLCFRLFEDLSSIVVHKNVAGRLVERGLTGFRFEDLDIDRV